MGGGRKAWRQGITDIVDGQHRWPRVEKETRSEGCGRVHGRHSRDVKEGVELGLHFAKLSQLSGGQLLKGP